MELDENVTTANQGTRRKRTRKKSTYPYMSVSCEVVFEWMFFLRPTRSGAPAELSLEGLTFWVRLTISQTDDFLQIIEWSRRVSERRADQE